MSCSSNEWVWIAICSGDLELLRSAPPDFDFTATHPQYGTPLTAFLSNLLCAGGAFPRSWAEREQYVTQLVAWLVERGAKPGTVAPANSKALFTVGFDADPDRDLEESELSVRCCGKSAVEVIIELRNQCRQLEKEDSRWASVLSMLNKLLQELARHNANTSQVDRVSVPEAVVDIWEKVLQDKRGADVRIAAEDGEAWAHAIVLSKASPVLAAMFASSMKEGAQQAGVVREVKVDEATKVMNIFLTLIYTGCLPMDASSEDMNPFDLLNVFDVCHRWQVLPFIELLATRLQTLIDTTNFERFLEAAILKGHASLKSACLTFARNSPEVKAMFTSKAFCPLVTEQLAPIFQSTADGERPQKKRRSI